MSESRSTDTLRTDVEELTRRLEAIQRELEPGDRRRLRPPTLRELRRFTADVTIPAVILVLETNVRALELLQRTLEVSDRDQRDTGMGVPVSDRAAEATTAALRRLDGALADLQASLGSRSGGSEFEELVAEARALQSTVEQRLSTVPEAGSDPVTIDVEAELESIKDELDDEDVGTG